MPPSVLSYVQGGCGDEFTQTQNANAFHHWGLVPRMLVDCSTRDLTVDLLGLKLPTPIFLSPIGVLGICTPDGHGDLAVARASAATGVPMIASTLSNDTLEAVAESLGDTPGFFQLYTPKDEALAESLIHRAEAAGFQSNRRHTRHLASGMATARPQRSELPAASRGRTSELLYGSLLSPLTREASRRGSLRRGHAVDSKHWQPPYMEASSMAAFSHQTASHSQGHLSSR